MKQVVYPRMVCVVVGSGQGANGIEAFIWDNANGMRSLLDVLAEQGSDVSDWTSLSNASAISADGRTIVGRGINSSGDIEAFVATIDVPKTVLLGDVNMDGAVSFLDITPFISFLNTGEFQAQADCDESGSVNFLDIQPFIAILTGS